MRKQKKGQQITVWFFALIFLFIIGLVYMIMTKPFVLIRDKFEANFTGSEFENTFKQINTMWRVWPILVIMGVIIWAVVASTRQTPNIPF